MRCFNNPCKNNGKCIANGINSFKCECDQVGYIGSLCEISSKPIQIVNENRMFFEAFEKFNHQNCFNWNKNIKNFCNQTGSMISVRQELVEENFFVFLNANKLCESYCKLLNDIECKDLHPNCYTWEKLGLCNKIKNKYPVYCRKSCGIC